MYFPFCDPRETCWENHVSLISLFWAPIFGPQKAPGPKWAPTPNFKFPLSHHPWGPQAPGGTYGAPLRKTIINPVPYDL